MIKLICSARFIIIFTCILFNTIVLYPATCGALSAQLSAELQDTMLIVDATSDSDGWYHGYFGNCGKNDYWEATGPYQGRYGSDLSDWTGACVVQMGACNDTTCVTDQVTIEVKREENPDIDPCYVYPDTCMNPDPCSGDPTCGSSPDGSPGSPDGSLGSPDGSPGSPDGSPGSPDGSPGSPDGSPGSPAGNPDTSPSGGAGGPEGTCACPPC